MAIAFIASIGVVLASVYALRMYIRSMHNRVGPGVGDFGEIGVRDASVIVPLVLLILAFALYPQRTLEAGERATRTAVTTVLDAADQNVAGVTR